MNTNLKTQMELRFDSSCAFRPAIGGRPGRRGRATWWFHQMRQIVDRALDREPAPAAPPEQIYLSWNRQRPVHTAPTGN